MRSRISLLLLLAACVQVNPSARYSCVTPADCGPGFECIARFEATSQCFRSGECVADEVCNGADDNCDGRVDETFPEAGEACATTALGVCGPGMRTCEIGQLACASRLAPSMELCDRLDNDCDGETDETFDLTSDESNCGACGVVCTTGTTCLSSRCEESECGDGDDNDSDGQIDCDDDACRGQVCATSTPPPWLCGELHFDGGSPLDAGTPDAGSLRGCFAPEQQCDNGFDDDGDGEVDCFDLDCTGRACVSGNVCTNRACPP